MIPQYTPSLPRESIAERLSEYIKSDSWLTQHKENDILEHEIEKLIGVPYCLTCNNGTIALSLALLANGIGPGDLVIVPNLTMVASANAVSLIGATPVFVDVDKENLCLDIEKTVEIISSRKRKDIKAVIYVTLNGRTHSTEELMWLGIFCKTENICIIEDNAQSFGSMYKETKAPIACQMGIGTYSFSPQKIITSGQGGCILTKDDDLYKKLRMLKDFGRIIAGQDWCQEFGINSKFTDIQAIILREQLKDFERRIRRKKETYRYYRQQLREVEEIIFIQTNDETTPWFTDIYVKDGNREELTEYLKQEGIQTRELYPPMHHQAIYKERNLTEMEVSIGYSYSGIWLPSSLNITKEEQNTVIRGIKEYYGY